MDDYFSDNRRTVVEPGEAAFPVTLMQRKTRGEAND